MPKPITVTVPSAARDGAGGRELSGTLFLCSLGGTETVLSLPYTDTDAPKDLCKTPLPHGTLPPQ